MSCVVFHLVACLISPSTASVQCSLTKVCSTYCCCCLYTTPVYWSTLSVAVKAVCPAEKPGLPRLHLCNLLSWLFRSVGWHNQQQPLAVHVCLYVCDPPEAKRGTVGMLSGTSDTNGSGPGVWAVNRPHPVLGVWLAMLVCVYMSSHLVCSCACLQPAHCCLWRIRQIGRPLVIDG